MVTENIQFYMPTDSYYRGVGLACLAILMSLLVAAKLSKPVRFYIKYSLYNSLYLALGLVSTPFLLLSPGDPDNSRWAARFARWSVKYLFGVRVSTTGLEHLNSDESYIAVCNHQSTIDPIGLVEIWPTRCTLVMKKSLKYAGPFGLAAILCGCVFLDRTNTAKAKGALAEVALTIKRKKAKVWIFPEGTRSLSYDTKEPMLPFKKGSFYLAVEAQVPIVPIVFSSQDHFFSFKEYRFTKGNFTVKVLPPVPTTGLTSEDVPQLTERIRKLMMDTFNEISQQISPR